MARTKIPGGYISDGAITSDHLHASHGITTTNIGEGTNQYFTDARVMTSMGSVNVHILPSVNETYDLGSASLRWKDLFLSGTTINLGGTKFSKDSNGDIEIKDSSDNPKKIKVSEIEFDDGTNVRRLKISGGKIKSFDGSDAAVKLDLSSSTTSDIAEGTNLYFTNARADARITAADTGDLSEGSNLYFTNARARAAISGTGSLSYNSTTGVMSFTMPAQNSDNITEGTSNLYFTNARVGSYLSSNGYATQSTVIAAITDSAPSTLDTLNELAAALGDDANFSTTITNSIATKLPLTGGAMTGAITTNSTFDGRDVATDGAKLDTIATSANNYVLPFTNNSTNWNTAYGWGNHASQSYITNSTASLDANKITSGVLNADRVLSPANGDWWNGGCVKVGTDGVMEVGKYLDFHTADSGGNTDYDLRVTASAGALTVGGTITATGGNSTNWNTAYTVANAALPKAGGALTGAITTNSTFDGRDVATDGATLDQIKTGGTLATYGTTAGASGRIRCTAPFNTNSGLMFQVTVSLYGSYTCHTYVVSGYMYSTINQWYESKAIYTGTGSPDIVVGRDSSGKAYISIANGSYMGVRVHNMTRGYQTTVADTYNPWTITVNAATENSVTPTISKVWHSTNDSSGSGLDADLLDGQEGSYYAPASTALTTSTSFGGDVSGTYNAIVVADDSHNHVISNIDGLQTALDAKLASSSYTAADVLTKIKTVDGSGSGLDADTVDGNEASAFILKGTQIASGAAWTTATRFGSVGELSQAAGNHALSVRSENNNDAFMSFHIGSDYAVHFGLDGTSNRLHVGGWSDGTGIQYQMYDSRDGSAANWNTAYTVANAALPKAGGTLTGTLNFSQPVGLGFANGQYIKDNGSGGLAIYSGAAINLTSTSFTSNGSTVWHSGNDGSGSGLDADLLDAQQGSYYLDYNNFTNTPSGGAGYLTQSSAFNNQGQGHSTRTSFATGSPSFPFGFNFVQGPGNSPGVNSAGQYYSLYTGLGSEYPATGSGSYGMELAIPRNVSSPYIAIRYNESNSLGSWQKISAGYADSAGSVAWGNVSGAPSFLGASATASEAYYLDIKDTRAGQYAPSDVPEYKVSAEFTNQIVSGWHSVFNLKGWHDGYATWQLIGGSDTSAHNNLYFRSGVNSTWGSTNTVWHSGSDGSGSGLDADLLDGLQLHTGTNNEVNKVVRTDVNGYCNFGWINSISGNHASTITRITASNDAYLRYVTPAQFRVQVIDGYYLPLAGGTVTGNTNFTGGLQIEGSQIWNGSDTWCRIPGQTGVYFSSYEGGVWMQDTTWVRIYNGKALYVANQIAATGNITAYYSDERLKTKTGKIENALEKVQSLSGFTYVENELARSLGYVNENEQVALSAQDVKKVMPQAVSLAPCDMKTDELTGVITSKSGEDYLTIDYARLVPLLVESIKEQQELINKLTSRLDDIEKGE
jgi:hypothetical protein